MSSIERTVSKHKKHWILVVEDEPIIAMNEEMMLVNNGYQVTTVLNSTDAQEMIRRYPEIDLVLMDINLGFGLDGIKAAKQILEIKEIPVVFLTSHSEKNIIDQVYQVTRYGYILKNSGEFVILSSIHSAYELFDARKRAEESELRLIKAQHISKTGSISYDLYHKVFQISKEVETIFDLHEEDRPFHFHHLKSRVLEDDLPLIDESLKEVSLRNNLEIEFRINAGGEIKWISAVIESVKDSQGGIQSYLGIVQDISRLRKAEKKIVEEKEKLSNIMNTSPVGIVIMDSKGQITEVNRQAVEILGFGYEQIVSRKYYDPGFKIKGIDSNEFPEEKLPFNLVMKTGKPVYHIEHSIVREDGTTVGLSINAAPVFNEKGEIESVVASLNDISERLRLEKDNAEKKKLYQELVENQEEGIGIVDDQDVFIFSNPAADKIFGVFPDSLVGCSIFEFLGSDEKEKVEIQNKLRDQGKTTKYILNINSQTGSKVTLSVRVSPRYNDQKQRIGAFGIFNDITQRKVTEQRLLESEERYRELFENIRSAIAVYETKDGGKTFTVKDFNQTAERYQRVSRELLVGHSAAEVIPYIQKKGLIDVFRKVYHSGVSIQHPVTDYKNGILQFWYDNYIYCLSSGEIVSVFEDVTESKKMEYENWIIRSRLEKAEKISKIGHWEFDLNTGQVISSEGARKIYGFEDVPLTVNDVQQIPLLKYREKLDHELNDLIRFGKPYNIRFEIKRHKDGKIVPVHSIAEYDAGSNIVFGVIRDMTDEVENRRKIRESEEKFREIFNHSNDALFLYSINDDGRPSNFLEVNQTAVLRLGYSREEFLKIGPDDINTSDHQDDSEEFYLHLLNHKYSIREVKHLSKDGNEMESEVNSHCFSLHGRNMVISVSRDIRDRKNDEKKIKELLSEKEMILREVHHRIKNDMISIRSILSLQAATSPYEQVGEALKDAQTRIDVMIKIYEKLYQSDEHHSIEIQSFIDSLISDIRKSCADKLKVTIVQNIPDIKLEAKKTVSLGMIVNELTANSLKYAFDYSVGSDKPEIQITIEECDDEDFIHLIFTDNGKGIPDSVINGNDFGFGLKLVHSLSCQNYGQFSIQRENGTVVDIRLHVGKK